MSSIDFDINYLETPYYIVDEILLTENLKKLKSVSEKTGCKILLAQKAFSMYSLYPLIGKYLQGTTASGIYEARLGFEEMGGETHVFSSSYTDNEIKELMSVCDYIIFNSFFQWEKYRKVVLSADKECGLRLNPSCSTQEISIYDPCSYGSRLGITKENFKEDLLQGLSGFHFHTLCEQNADALEKTLFAVEEQFGKYFYGMKWINFGGGHHITRNDYDIELLCSLIEKFQEKYKVQVYLEPGEAVVLNTGYFVNTVIDIIDNGIKTAVLDGSAACHMPDVLEMPYRPKVIGAGQQGEKPYLYRLGGPTCLAGDIIGDYSFDVPLARGDKLIFCDMAHYTMVKNNTFNGMPLPSIAIVDKNRNIHLQKKFGYKDFKERLS